MERTNLRLDQIRLDGGTQLRAKVNETTVKEYAQALRGGAAFPAVIVFYDGTDYWLADGFHRVEAAKQVGKDVVVVEVRWGSQRDAVLYAAGANAAHGLRRTNADKRAAVTALLQDQEWRQWSDGAIAQKCGVSDRFVGKVRKGVSPNGSETKRKVRRRGTTFTMETAHLGAGPAGRATPARAAETTQAGPVAPGPCGEPEALAAVLRVLREAGIDATGASPEHQPGTAWIEFRTAQDAGRFLNVAADAGKASTVVRYGDDLPWEGKEVQVPGVAYTLAVRVAATDLPRLLYHLRKAHGRSDSPEDREVA